MSTLNKIIDRQLTYLHALRLYCKAEGEVVMRQSLLDDIAFGQPPSPASIGVLLRSFGGDYARLEGAITKHRRLASSAWHEVMRAGHDCAAPLKFYEEPCERFRALVRQKTADCDFRRFVGRRISALAKRVDENETVDISIEGFLGAYADLMDKRAKEI